MPPSDSPRRIAIACQLQWPLRRLCDLIAGAQEYAEEAGWESEICYVPDVRMEQGAHFDGIVGRLTLDAVTAAEHAGIPAVNVWLGSPTASQVPNVFVDLEAVGQMAAEHLIARGFRRIIALGPKRWVSTKHFIKGVEATAREHEVTYSRCLMPTNVETQIIWPPFFP